ncbi:MAG: PAS domain S-box protein, partial [Spirulinaceae cyanobacterium RM2_2_10]|nr:PAS domain S-box protein [Spirulinaceae cyanobacterium RM2_2_10]
RDVDSRSLVSRLARIYPDSIASDLSPEYLGKSTFNRVDDSYQVVPSLREMLIFASHDLTQNAGFSKMSLISCRNVLIYMQPPLQQQVLRLLHFSLAVGGTLYLGSSETPGDLCEEFVTLDTRWKLFRKRRNSQLRAWSAKQQPLHTMSQSRDRPPVSRGPLNRILAEALKFCFAGRTMTSLLVSSDNRLVHIIYNSGQLLELPVTGTAELDVVDLVPVGLRVPLSTALHRAKCDQRSVAFHNIQLEHSGQHFCIDLRIGREPDNPLLEPYFIVVFEIETRVSDSPTDVTAVTTPAISIESDESELKAATARQLSDLEYELQQTRENLQVTIEELETTNEEQEATNEELLAANEELQSTNEELQTVNEELYTVNVEYHHKIAELTQLTDDIDNLLRNTDIGVVFLGKDLCVRKFTPAATRAINLQPTDLGRPLSDFTNNLADGDNLVESLRAVLARGTSLDREIEIEATGEQFLMRTNPYYTAEGDHDGLVITFVNIDTLRQMQQQLSLTNQLLENVYDSTPVGLCLLDTDYRYLRINHRLAAINGFSVEAHLGRTAADLMPEIADTVEPLLRQVLQTGEPVVNRRVVGTTPAEPDVLRYWLVTYYPVDLGGGQRGVGSVVTEITELQQTQEKLQESQQLLQSIADTSPGIVYVCNLSDRYRLVYCNGSAVALGYCEDPDFTLVNRPLTDAMHPDDREQALEQLTALANDPDCDTVRIDYRLRCEDGSYRWFSSSNRIFSTTESGAAEKVIGVALDVSDRMAAEAARRESEERFHAFMAHAPSLNWIISADGHLLYANAAYQSVLTCPLEEAIGRHLRELFTPEDAERYLLANHQIVTTGESREWVEITHVDTQSFEFLVNAFLIQHSDEGRDCIGGVGIDITARREAERLLEAYNQTLETRVTRQTAILRDRETSLANLVASLPGAAYRRRVDDDWTLLWVSDFVSAVAGYTASELQHNRDHSFARLIPARERARVTAEIATAIAAGQPFGCEYRLRHRDGRRRWVYDRGRGVVDAEGRVQYLEGILFDVSDRKQIQLDLEAAKVAAEAADRTKSEFLANMSHEIRTPMTSVLGFASLLQAADLDPKSRRFVEAIDRNGQMLLQIVNDILDLSKLEARELEQK